jgi:hypothetical protein
VRFELRDVESRLDSAHGQMARQLETRERQAAQIDARGLWPVGFGIILTGIPGQLAEAPAAGWTVVGLAVLTTVMLGLGAIRRRPAAPGQ